MLSYLIYAGIFSPFISHEQIRNGATLEFELEEYPHKEWGNEPILPLDFDSSLTRNHSK